MTDPVEEVQTPIRLDYFYTAGKATSRFLRGMARGKILGQRCPACSKVYVPPRGGCPQCGVPTDEEVEVSHRGTITTFCIVNVPFYGQSIKPPYVSATILLDGADIGFFHLVQEIPADQVRIGTRVEAVWVPPAERHSSFESIRHFRPTGEPDVPIEKLQGYV
jgi:uncharacterized OB-fold protein